MCTNAHMSSQHRRLYGDSCDDDNVREFYLVSLRRADVIVTESDEDVREAMLCVRLFIQLVNMGESKMTSLCAERQHTSIDCSRWLMMIHLNAVT
jgi:hypothetical protein